MTVIRLINGGLVVHSPTRLDLASRQEFQRLGPIVAIVAPSWWHDLYLREYLSAYPDARLYGAPTLVRWNRSLPFVEALGDAAPSLWTGEIDQLHVQGSVCFWTRSYSVVGIADRSLSQTYYSI